MGKDEMTCVEEFGRWNTDKNNFQTNLGNIFSDSIQFDLLLTLL